MSEIPFLSLFYIKNEASLITALRSITTKFLITESIDFLENINLRPLKRKTKMLEFCKDKNEDIHYIEHPTGLYINLQNEELKNWNRVYWYSFIKHMIDLTYQYSDFQSILSKFLEEVDSIFEHSINSLDFLLREVPELKDFMIKPYYFLYYQIDLDYESMKKINWKSILKGHIENINIIFTQIINVNKKEKILIDILETVKVLSSTVNQENSNIKLVVLQFKKQIHRILNNYTKFVQTKDIDYKEWFLSLTKFLMYCKPIHFDLRLSVAKFNLLLFLSKDNVDELLEIESDVVYKSWKSSHYKPLSKQKKKKLDSVHPFIRNVHIPLIFKS